jgi:3-oxoacyl-[acyl-carrier protein] reductase
MLMNINLTGRTALVTGATGQLGRVMARTLASCGADVIIHYLNNETKAMEIKTEIEAMGRKAMIAQADISDLASMMAMKERIFEQFDRLDIIVANAVSQYTWTSILEQAPEDYLDQFNSCVIQSVLLTKAFVPHMIENKYGRIIGINTECSLQTFPNQSAYVAAKRGMDGLYRILAKEIGEHQITVNQVAPGWMISEKYRETETESQTEYEKMVPLNRRGEDQDIANTVAFLASELANFITGGFIPVSGGSVMVGI